MKPVPHGEPYAGKLHVRFDEGAGVPHGASRSTLLVAEYAIMRGMRALPTPNAACKSWVHCRRCYREPSFAAAEVSPCGQGKKVGLVSYSTTLTPPLGTGTPSKTRLN